MAQFPEMLGEVTFLAQQFKGRPPQESLERTQAHFFQNKYLEIMVTTEDHDLICERPLPTGLDLCIVITSNILPV